MTPIIEAVATTTTTTTTTATTTTTKSPSSWQNKLRDAHSRFISARTTASTAT
jgi:hypothetical protein